MIRCIDMKVQKLKKRILKLLNSNGLGLILHDFSALVKFHALKHQLTLLINQCQEEKDHTCQ